MTARPVLPPIRYLDRWVVPGSCLLDAVELEHFIDDWSSIVLNERAPLIQSYDETQRTEAVLVLDGLAEALQQAQTLVQQETTGQALVLLVIAKRELVRRLLALEDPSTHMERLKQEPLGVKH